MIVKICGITHRGDALTAVAAGASALGFNFYHGSPRYVTLEAAAAIIEALPAAIWKVGVFVNEPPERVAAVAAAAGLDVVQLHGDVPFPAGLRVWKALPVDSQFRLEQLAAWPHAEAFLLDAAAPDRYGGTGQTFPWAVAREAAQKVILAGGLDADNVREAIRIARPWGVDACSRLEREPGRKDHARMVRFIEAALSEAQT